jgi:hypothetical protein
MMIRPRWLAKVLADVGGYFWLPCPICKEPFAGFEWGESIMTGNLGQGVCSKPECGAEARKRSTFAVSSDERENAAK